MYRIGVKCRFSAAHRLEGHRGRCSRLHGHSWMVEAVFAADEISSGGMLLDFDDARAVLEDVVAPFDHCFLNEVEPFDRVAPTAENVARVAVSYTHLRAHETRHDLVCRLLLEKKKPKQIPDTHNCSND